MVSVGQTRYQWTERNVVVGNQSNTTQEDLRETRTPNKGNESKMLCNFVNRVDTTPSYLSVYHLIFVVVSLRFSGVPRHHRRFRRRFLPSIGCSVCCWRMSPFPELPDVVSTSTSCPIRETILSTAANIGTNNKTLPKTNGSFLEVKKPESVKSIPHSQDRCLLFWFLYFPESQRQQESKGLILWKTVQ